MKYTQTNEGQLIFDNFVGALAVIAKGFIKLLILSPFIFTAYLISLSILHYYDHALLWITLMMVFTWILYVLFFEIKKRMLILKMRKNKWWIVIFIFCIAFSCLVPAWIMYEIAEFFSLRMTGEQNAEIVSFAISISFGFFIYKHNHFFELNTR